MYCLIQMWKSHTVIYWYVLVHTGKHHFVQVYRIPYGFKLVTALVSLSLRQGQTDSVDLGIMIRVPGRLAAPELETGWMSGNTCASEATLPAAELRAAHLRISGIASVTVHLHPTTSLSTSSTVIHQASLGAPL
jgi:hypothetical protein